MYRSAIILFDYIHWGQLNHSKFGTRVYKSLQVYNIHATKF